MMSAELHLEASVAMSTYIHTGPFENIFRGGYNGSGYSPKTSCSQKKKSLARSRPSGKIRVKIRQTPAEPKSGKIRQNPSKSGKIRQNPAKSGCTHLGCTLPRPTDFREHFPKTSGHKDWQSNRVGQRVDCTKVAYGERRDVHDAVLKATLATCNLRCLLKSSSASDSASLLPSC